jgi:hypothetical protein
MKFLEMLTKSRNIWIWRTDKTIIDVTNMSDAQINRNRWSDVIFFVKFHIKISVARNFLSFDEILDFGALISGLIYFSY